MYMSMYFYVYLYIYNMYIHQAKVLRTHLPLIYLSLCLSIYFLSTYLLRGYCSLGFQPQWVASPYSQFVIESGIFR